jgi:hypothetical protein
METVKRGRGRPRTKPINTEPVRPVGRPRTRTPEEQKEYRKKYLREYKLKKKNQPIIAEDKQLPETKDI